MVGIYTPRCGITPGTPPHHPGQPIGDASEGDGAGHWVVWAGKRKGRSGERAARSGGVQGREYLCGSPRIIIPRPGGSDVAAERDGDHCDGRHTFGSAGNAAALSQRAGRAVGNGPPNGRAAGGAPVAATGAADYGGSHAVLEPSPLSGDHRPLGRGAAVGGLPRHHGRLRRARFDPPRVRAR